MRDMREHALETTVWGKNAVRSAERCVRGMKEMTSWWMERWSLHRFGVC